MLADVIRKLAWAGIIAAVLTCATHLLVGWLSIYPLGPAHPEVLPSRAFHEDVLDPAAWVTVLFAFMEIVALGISCKLLVKAPLGLVLTVAGLVPGLIVLLFAARVPWFYFDSPPGAVAFFFAFVLLTFLSLYAGLRLTKTRST